MKSKILVLGATGMIGHRIYLEALKSFKGDVLGISRRGFKEIISLDVQDWNLIRQFLDNHKPDWIINAVGITLRKPELKIFDTTLEVNALFPHRLEKWCEQNSKRLIHLSTDCVFSGETGAYVEESIPSAKEIYGKTKFLGEVIGESALTLRFSCIGREREGKTELLEWFLAQKGKTINGFSNAIYSGLTNIVIAKEVLKIIHHYPELSGLYQISSSPISKYELLCLAKKAFNVDVSIVPDANFFSDKSLLCDKYKMATGFKSASWPEMLDELVLAGDEL